MRVIDLALKDLNQLIRDWKAALFLLIMPIGFTLLFGYIFSGSGGDLDPRLPVGVLDQDGGTPLSTHLLDLLESSDTIRPVVLSDVDVEDIREQIGNEELAAAILIPIGYSQQILATERSAVRKPLLILDPDSTQGRSAQEAIQTTLVRLLGAVESAQLTARAYEAQGGTADQAFLEEAVVRAIDAWQDPALTVSESESSAITEAEESNPYGDNSFAHSSAGIMIQFAMAGLIGAAEIVVLERKSGAMRRLLTTPISRAGIILGHFLAMFAMIITQLIILVLFGQVFLDVEYLRAPFGTLLMITVTAFWAASLGLLIGIFSRTQEQVIIFCLLVMMLLSGLGGAWIPLEVTGRTFQTVGRLTPAAWAIDGFENLVVRGLGFDSVVVPAAILFGYAVVFFAAAVWRFRFE